MLRQSGQRQEQDRIDWPATPDVDVRIVDTEDGDRDLRSGEVGELIMRAPQHCEVLEQPEETAATLGRMVPADPGLLRRFGVHGR